MVLTLLELAKKKQNKTVYFIQTCLTFHWYELLCRKGKMIIHTSRRCEAIKQASKEKEAEPVRSLHAKKVLIDKVSSLDHAWIYIRSE